MKDRFVQVQNPRTKEYLKIDTELGRIVGKNKEPFKNIILKKMKKEIKIHPLKFYRTFWSGLNLKREWRWNIRAKNGRIIAASSEGYANFKDCEYNAKSTAASIQAHFGTSPIEQLAHALKEDEGYFQSWKANIAMSFLDAMGEDNLVKPNLKEKILERANTAAENFLQQLIK